MTITFQGSPSFPNSPVAGVILDVMGNNAFFQNLWSGGFNVSQLAIYEYYHTQGDFSSLQILAPSFNGDSWKITQIAQPSWVQEPMEIDTTGNFTLNAPNGSIVLNSTGGIMLLLNGGGSLNISAGGSTYWNFGNDGSFVPMLGIGASPSQQIGNNNRPVGVILCQQFRTMSGTTPGPNLLGGTGVPAAGLGANGDYYHRLDGAASAHIYFKSAGAWTGIV